MREKKRHILIFVAGFLAVAVMGIPYVLLGQDVIVTCHDQLDGEVIAYLLRARHLFQGNTLPEFMNGASKTALVPPAPACVLLFLTGNVSGALGVMQVAGSLFGYCGMYLLVREGVRAGELSIAGSRTDACCAAAAGVLYAYLPFLPVYGLSQYGLPLLLWCLLQARKGRFVKTGFAYGAFYALNSSLVLVGFGALGVMAVRIVWDAVQKRRHGRTELHPGYPAAIWLVMLGLYIASNIGLLRQTFGAGQDEISHKAEYVLTPVGFLDGLWTGFTRGGQHSEDFHYLFLLGLAAVTALCALRRTGVKMLPLLGTAIGWNVFFAGAAALWNAAPVVALRSRFGALGAFQMDRLLWMAPCLWYFALGCALALAAELAVSAKRGLSRLPGGICCGVMAVLLCVTGGKALLESNLRPNVQKLCSPDYGAFSVRDYYAVGVLDQVQDYIYETTGEQPEDYRVVSLGIDPAAALYHGFYCLDGYSNNYSLEYKHLFRRVIEPELARSEYLQNYFDAWGNRCYLFSAECPGYYTVQKGGFFFQNYEVDAESLREMGGKYLISAAYIQNAGETGLTLAREEAFETQDSYYRLYLYRVGE